MTEDMNPYNGTTNDNGRQSHRFRLSEEGFRLSEPEPQGILEDPGDEQAIELMRDLIRVVLVEDFGARPVEPCYVDCSQCEAFQNLKCRLKSDPQPKRLPGDGCFEGIPRRGEE